MTELGGIQFDVLIFRVRSDREGTATLYVATAAAEQAIREYLPASYQTTPYKRVDLHIREGEGPFWLLANQDCFDPPMAVIQAAAECTAIDIFVEDFPYGPKIAEPDLRDYLNAAGEPDCNFTDGGTPYDASNLCCWPVEPWLALRFREAPRPAGPAPTAPPPAATRTRRRRYLDL